MPASWQMALMSAPEILSGLKYEKKKKILPISSKKNWIRCWMATVRSFDELNSRMNWMIRKSLYKFKILSLTEAKFYVNIGIWHGMEIAVGLTAEENESYIY